MHAMCTHKHWCTQYTRNISISVFSPAKVTLDMNYSWIEVYSQLAITLENLIQYYKTPIECDIPVWELETHELISFSSILHYSLYIRLEAACQKQLRNATS